MSHPPVKASPSLNPPTSLPKGVPNSDSHPDSHSAPSSPTHNPPPSITPRNDVRRSNSPAPGRPRSVMVNSELNYTELKFPIGVNSHPTPRPRVMTNYTQVITQELPPPPAISETEAEPPLIEGVEIPGQDIGQPVDPFADGDTAAWEDDPEAFYDRPPPARPLAPPTTSPWGAESDREGISEEGVPRGDGRSEGSDDTADTTADDDCTGGSAYMDTSQFLRTKCSGGGEGGGGGGRQMDPYLSPEDQPSPPDGLDEPSTPTGDEVPGEFGPYDFPSALANFPPAAGGGGGRGEKQQVAGGEEAGREAKQTPHNSGLSLGYGNDP